MRYNTIIDQGATWQRTFTLQDSNGNLINLTGCTAQMQFRSSPDSPTVLVTPTLTLGGVAGTIQAIIPYTALEGLDLSTIQTGTLFEIFSTPLGNVPYKATGPIVYGDLKVTFSDGVTVERIVDITACISKEVTHA